MIALLQLIPGVKWVLDWLGNFGLKFYNAKLEALGSHEAKVAELAGRELRIQELETRVQGEYKIATIGKWYEPTHLMGWIMVIYWGKVIVLDIVVGSMLGYPWSTIALRGDTAATMNLITAFWLGKRTLENVTSIWRMRG